MKSTERFSDRVQDYTKYRPTYPREVLDLLTNQFGLDPSQTVVDVGAGTGISSEMFLKNGNFVFAIEPNSPMRQEAEKLKTNFPQFNLLEATAEKTNLPDRIADWIVSAQAFHWFEPKSTQKEFKRILKPHGHVVILFNDRKLHGTPFLEAYEHLLEEFGTDYKKIRHTNIDEARLRDFLGDFQSFYFPNHQDFNYEGLLGRLKSSSYTPKSDDPKFLEMEKSLKKLFEANQKNGMVRMEYETQVYVARWE